MNLSNSRSWLGQSRIRPNAGFLLGGLTITALIAFEMFNYSTTDFALRDLLGSLSFLGIPWSTILAIAFCGIDFAGIARLFLDNGGSEPKETWYLFGAWFLAATMNGMLTWWGVSMAVVNHTVKSTAVIDSNTLIKIIPIFIALMVWTIRVLIIGTISLAGNRMFTIRPRRFNSDSPHPRTNSQPATAGRSVVNPSPMVARSHSSTTQNSVSEPTYQSMR